MTRKKPTNEIDSNDADLPFEGTFSFEATPAPELPTGIARALANGLTGPQLDALVRFQDTDGQAPGCSQLVAQGWAYEDRPGHHRLHPSVRDAMFRTAIRPVPAPPRELKAICNLMAMGFPELSLGTPDLVLSQRAVREGWLVRNKHGVLEPTAECRLALWAERMATERAAPDESANSAGPTTGPVH